MTLCMFHCTESQYYRDFYENSIFMRLEDPCAYYCKYFQSIVCVREYASSLDIVAKKLEIVASLRTRASIERKAENRVLSRFLRTSIKKVT